jgi:hypothetical protein
MWVVATDKYTAESCTGLAWVISLGSALGFGLLGADATARGQIPTPGNLGPITFSAGGGVAVMIIVFSISVWSCPDVDNGPNGNGTDDGRQHVSVSLPDGILLKEAVDQFVKSHGYDVEYEERCPDSLLDAKLEGGLVETRGEDAIENYILRLQNKTKDEISSSFSKVSINKNRGVTYVRCGE